MHNSLAKRLTYRIMAVVLVMIAVITGIVYLSVREYMQEEAQERYLGILLKTHEETRRRLSDVYVATINNVDYIEHDLDDPEKAAGHVERIVSTNSKIASCGLLFQPDYYPEKGRCFVPFATRDSVGMVHVSRIDSIFPDYAEADWYQERMRQDNGDWTDPYFENPAVSKVGKTRLLNTFAIPIHDRQGHAVALLCSDMSLESMRKEIMKDMRTVNEKYEKGRSHQSYCFVIDRKGTYIIHPDSQSMLNKSYVEKVRETTDTQDDRIVSSMVKGDKGSAMVEIDGVPSWIYYHTIKYVDWTIVIVVPEDVIHHNGRMLNAIILLTVLIGLLAIWFFCRHSIEEITSPVTAQQAAIERELKIAHDIQMAMLPGLREKGKGESEKIFDLYASVTPALDVGGDLYDYYVRDNRLFFCIGDVSGKGMPAALMMAVMRAMFRSETRRAESAAELVDTMNRNLSEESTAGYFITMFVGILDLQTGHLDYCNAGHEAPIEISSLQPLNVKRNLPIGALPDWNYEGQEVQLNDGDMLFLYTDGLNEAKNTDGQQFGRKRVMQLVGEHISDTARQLVEQMEAEIHRYMDGAPQSDDITLLALRWNDPRRLQTETSMCPYSMRASMDEIGGLQPYIEHVAKQAGIDDKEAKRLRLAVEEAVANIINHGRATTITITPHLSPLTPQLSPFNSHLSTLNPQPSTLNLIIEDDGQPFDPTKAPATDLSVPPDQRPPGGLGIMLLHKMTDGLEYQRTDGHNILTLRKNIKH